MNLYKFHTDPESLKHHEAAHENVPKLKWDRMMEQEGKDAFKKYEHLWAKDAKTAYDYAALNNKPFPAGEKAIASDTGLSYRYAAKILGKRFPAGEKAIAKNPWYSYEYADTCLNQKPFPAGEKAIATSAEESYLYATNVLETRFPAGEKAIATDAQYSYDYAYYILDKKPFPAGEKAIATAPSLSYFYAVNILGRRFPAGEKAIAANAQYRRRYEQKYDVKLPDPQ